MRSGNPLSGRKVLLDGQPGVLLVFAGARPGQVRLLVVNPDYGPDHAVIIADTTVGVDAPITGNADF